MADPIPRIVITGGAVRMIVGAMSPQMVYRPPFTEVTLQHSDERTPAPKGMSGIIEPAISVAIDEHKAGIADFDSNIELEYVYSGMGLPAVDTTAEIDWGAVCDEVSGVSDPSVEADLVVSALQSQVSESSAETESVPIAISSTVSEISYETDLALLSIGSAISESATEAETTLLAISSSVSEASVETESVPVAIGSIVSESNIEIDAVLSGFTSPVTEATFEAEITLLTIGSAVSDASIEAESVVVYLISGNEDDAVLAGAPLCWTPPAADSLIYY